ncbi:MAG: hypothetical protein AAGD34_22920, partial [Pseudomonadota bacterium]
SFLTFNFGKPKLMVTERRSGKSRRRRSAHVRGDGHIWIYCCDWRALQEGRSLASCEDNGTEIARATARLNGQKLMGVEVQPDGGRSIFRFDLGGALETWPWDEDPTDVQWIIYQGAETFSYRADGLYHQGLSNDASDDESWLAFP